MPILGAFMVPHPPIIMPEIGCGEEEKISQTTKAYEQVASEIAELKPDTIIISSPHSIMYADYFHISPGEGASGDMSKFNAPEVSFDAEYDTELVEKICDICKEGGPDFEGKKASHEFPAGTMGERDKNLDHGTLIPLYFICKKYTDFKLVRIGLSGLPLPLQYQMGQIIKKAVDETGRRVVYVASGDLSHKMKEDGAYGLSEEGPVYDERIMEVCGSGDFIKLFDFSSDFCEKAAECGHRSFVMMAGALDGLSVKAEALSHEAPFGVGYGICRFEVGGPDDNRHFLEKWRNRQLDELKKNQANEDPYVRLARLTINTYIKTGKTLTIDDFIDDFRESAAPVFPKEMLSKKAGSFVSLHKNHALRGCIGTIAPCFDCVAEEIIHNAISAATADPRFPMLTDDELPWLEISVDVLDTPEPISSTDKLDVKRYGIIVRNGMRQGVLLPNLDGVDNVNQQINIACQKAGIAPGEEIELQRFEVVRHK
ncbi:MAG: AmmeMemoRadiSam system protein A [Butyrivibrio sp.]|nr:AmmeMemoRadiSam system protein A [Butyrivibrio sp.]